MAEELFKIVFKGEIGLDFEEDEVKEKLQTFCRFDRERVERLFSGGAFVLTKNIDQEKASRLEGQFQKIGALVEIQSMGPPASLPVFRQPPPTPQSAAEESSFKCPACGFAQEKGLVCIACGIAFAKRESMQQRQREMPAATPEYSPTLLDYPTGGASAATPTHNAAPPFFASCGALMLGAAGLQVYFFGMDMMIAGFIVLIAVFLMALMILAVSRDEGVLDELEKHAVLEFERLEQKPQRFPVATYSLLLSHLLLYYAVVVPLGRETVKTHLAFLPESANLWNVPLSALASLFLHESQWQLWGGGIFLCAIGAAIEERLGWIRLLSLYLGLGIIAGAAGGMAHHLLMKSPLHALGSSGAVAGLLGVACIFCRRSVTFPLPFFGAISLLAPVRLRVSLNPLLLIGFFFFFNFSGGMNTAGGLYSSLAGHLLHLGGFLAGLLIGTLLDPQETAQVESAPG